MKDLLEVIKSVLGEWAHDIDRGIQALWPVLILIAFIIFVLWGAFMPDSHIDPREPFG